MNKLARLSAPAILAALATLTQPAMAQSTFGAQPKTGNEILGYLDPATGAFRPVAPAAVQDESAAATVSPTTGKFVFSFTITVASSIPSSQSIICNAVADVTDVGGTYSEEASTTASRSGSTATCTVTIPYSWLLSAPASDAVGLVYTIEAGATTTIATTATRLSTHTLPTIKVPVTGATTTQTIKATI